jgi:hypothetical protein
VLCGRVESSTVGMALYGASERASELRALIECDDLGLLVVNDDDDCVPNKICDKAVT